MTATLLLTKRMAPRGSPPVLEFVTSSDIRRKLLEHLAGRPRTPTELASLENKHVSHVSRALAELKARGLVESRFSESRKRYYQTTEAGMAIYAFMIRLTK